MRMLNGEQRTKSWWPTAGVVLFAILVLAFGTQAIFGQAGLVGRWTTLPYLMPINPVHIAVLNNGKVLVIAGSGNVAEETNFRASLWDTQAGTFSTRSLAWDMFCNGMVVLADGRVFINGGNLRYDPFYGHKKNAVYNPSTDTYTDVRDMAHGRWYPTTTMLGDGRVMSFSGLLETGGTNTAVEIYTPGTDSWSPEYPAGWTPPLYPRMHLNTDGNVFYAGSGTGSRIFNTTTNTWSSVVETTNYPNSRSYGTSVMLPLMPATGYRPRVMIFGGGSPATATTEIIDLAASPLNWAYGPSMSQPRIQLNATILPNGKVLIVGGSTNNEDANTKSLNADLYDPATNIMSPAGQNVYPRLYHSGSLLLPDATVLLVGGNPTRGSYENHIEIYSPAYLFNADGSAAARPTISSVSAGPFAYGSTFQVQTPNAANITSVALVRPGAQTHAFDMDQRMIGLSFTSGAGVLNVTAPPNGNIAPPGYYMLFLLNSAGVPSVASFVQLLPSVANQIPTATITSPTGNVTINPGQSVSFAGTGSDPDGTISAYSWTFAGGNPASSTVANPGSVNYATPGSHVASFRVTDNRGALSPTVNRTVTVSDFTLSATPTTRTVLPGAGTTYSATVTPGTGFTGNVAFSVTGLPTGATATFSPTSVNTSGSTTMSVSTTSATPGGTYTLTIRGTSGPRIRTVNVTLVVVGDFTITAQPTSRTITRGAATTYNVTLSPGPGFTGVVNLSVSGGPSRATYVFNPASITTSGTSVLTVDTRNNVQRGTRTFTIRGTSGSRVRSTTVTLIIQ
jgi:hypothetical protein